MAAAAEGAESNGREESEDAEGRPPERISSDSEGAPAAPREGASDEDEGEEEEDVEEGDSDSEYDWDYSYGVPEEGGAKKEKEEEEDPRGANARQFLEVLESPTVQNQLEEEEQEYVFYEDLFDFPRDPERWREEDLRELWADAPIEATQPGWDPIWADDDDWEVVDDEMTAGRDPPIGPFYIPYRKYLPVIPDNHHDISDPKSVIEELDRIEEFLTWVSYIFPDGSSYEGTIWDDLAHGKGVYVTAQGLVRYEGEWLQNAMEGHGVVEVDIPSMEPVPGSKLEENMRSEGRLIARDFMSPEDKRWMEMDIEDSIRLAGNQVEIPFYEREEWITLFGHKPEKGRYKYAGQWKHGRMHGCGVYEVNEQIIYGRFYFGEYLDESTGCDADVSALHAGIAEVAAAKARMFVNKPDGMVREDRGPYGDPQHPYFYDEDDAWMAPGFVNQFYEVPDYWKTYVEEVDQEREMWLNSFYKAPLRIPMPAELEYWWSKEKRPEFVLINKEPEPDPDDPSKLIYKEDPLILHTPSGRLINYVEDKEHGVRLFWQPPLREGEDVNPEKADFLPLGFDEFYGQAAPVKERQGGLMGIWLALEDRLKPLLDRLEKWAEERKKVNELNLKLIDQELEFIEAEICLEEAIEDMEMELNKKQKEEERKAETGEDDDSSGFDSGIGALDEGEDEDEEVPPSSFGTVATENKPGKNAFSSLSLSFSSSQAVPCKLLGSFSSWKNAGQAPDAEVPSDPVSRSPPAVHFRRNVSREPRLGTASPPHLRSGRRSSRSKNTHHRLDALARMLSTSPASGSSYLPGRTSPAAADGRLRSVLSLSVPLSGAAAVPQPPS